MAAPDQSTLHKEVHPRRNLRRQDLEREPCAQRAEPNLRPKPCRDDKNLRHSPMDLNPAGASFSDIGRETSSTGVLAPHSNARCLRKYG
jgi:hypothetical protein